MADDDGRDDSSSRSGSSDAESDESEQVELLVQGRERRKTAGNRYDRDMVVEEAENDEEPDEVALLFAAEENEEDEEFRSEGSDEDEMSSSDDDDQGPEAGAGDLEGEQELQKQAKEERTKKRKAELALTSTAGLRKKVKIDPSQRKEMPKKPSKKKERESWLPEVDTSAARSSLRKQTIAHREETLARLKESEAQSKKLRALKEKRDREKARDAPKEMTQADRLAEAERVERRNAKSLNRWETSEKKRTEEQAAKLAALKNRKIDGAVITLWSGKAYYRGPRPSQVWKEPDENSGEPKKRGRKPKGYHEQMAAMRAAAESVPVSGQQTPLSQSQSQPRQDTPSQPPPAASQASGPSGFFLSGIHEYASMQPDTTAASSTHAATPKSMPDEQSAEAQDTSGPIPVEQRVEEIKVGQTQKAEEAPTPTSLIRIPDISGPPSVDGSTGQSPHPVTQPMYGLSQATNPPVQVIEEGYTTKNLVILNQFDDLSETARQAYGLFYNSKRTAKPVKHNTELCPITMQAARYRDPATGIGYANMFAYKVLQELKEHRFTWSAMLGCYVGREGGKVARGVPEGYPGK
jgi:vacuolar protein sorting-associated protein 72